MKQEARKKGTVWPMAGDGWVGRAEPKNRGGRVRWRIAPEEVRESVNEHLLRAYCQLVMKNRNIFSCVSPSTGLWLISDGPCSSLLQPHGPLSSGVLRAFAFSVPSAQNAFPT